MSPLEETKVCSQAGLWPGQISPPGAAIVHITVVERGGALAETMTFNRRVVGSTPALAAV